MAAALVKHGASRYPARMEPLTIETLRIIAKAQGLELSDQDLHRLLPLVQAGRSMMEALATIPVTEIEPTSQYRIL